LSTMPGQAVCSYAQSARWVLQFMAGTLGEVLPLERCRG
jgi:hypothetical protein